MFDNIQSEKGACGRYKNKNTNNVMFHHFRKYSIDKKAPAAAIKMNKNINEIFVHHVRQYSVGKGACGRYKGE